METKGFETPANSPGKTLNSQSRGTESGTLRSPPQAIASHGNELQTVIGAWPSLPATVRARIVGLVEGATASREG
jgi:hypothetical protein